ncbi:MAG: hypothetical protein ACJAWZ_003178, partial [Paracoccaceae bacterium]
GIIAAIAIALSQFRIDISPEKIFRSNRPFQPYTLNFRRLIMFSFVRRLMASSVPRPGDDRDVCQGPAPRS